MSNMSQFIAVPQDHISTGQLGVHPFAHNLIKVLYSNTLNPWHNYGKVKDIDLMSELKNYTQAYYNTWLCSQICTLNLMLAQAD